MTTESFRGKAVTIKSTGEKGIIQSFSHRRNGSGALSVRYVVQVENDGTLYECMPHEVTIIHEPPMMGMSY